jgi:hypothetical protein
MSALISAADHPPRFVEVTTFTTWPFSRFQFNRLVSMALPDTLVFRAYTR